MSHQHHNKPGYILVLTLIIVAGIMALVNQLFQQGQTHTAFTKTMVEREKAKMLALSGVEIARSQLTLTKPKKDTQVKTTTDTKKKQRSPELTFLQRILPVINRWQTFTFTKKRDGMEGKIKIAVSCEEGKLNINQLFDFEKKQFKGARKLEGNMQELLKRLMGNAKKIVKADLFPPLTSFLTKRGRPLDDVTQLLSVDEFKQFSQTLFYQPPTAETARKHIYLTDLFTIWSDTSKIEPWLLSDSLCAILGLRQAKAGEIVTRKQQVETLTRKFKKNATWSSDWDVTFRELYGKTFNMLPDGMGTMLNKQFEPETFSVISHGTSGSVTQRVYAIVKRYIDNSKAYYEEPEIIKLYWI